MSRLRLLPALLTSCALVLVPASAQAHDELTGSDPQDGATVEADELDELTLSFSGEIAQVGAAVTVTGPDGGSVLDGEPEADGTEVTQDLVDDLGDGDYAVAWRVTSEDGHPISGEFGFTVTGGTEEEQDTAPAPTDETEDATGTVEPEPTATETETEAEATTPEETADATSEDGQTSDAATADTSSGLPVWAWVLLAAGGVGVLVLMAATWQRQRR